MNERIQELIKQAENYAAEQNDKFGVSYKKEYNQKFAELIVQECIGVIGEENYTMLTGKAYCTELKRHFGVEE